MEYCSTDLSQNKITELLVSVVDELTLHKTIRNGKWWIML